jgi:hypothetical protein
METAARYTEAKIKTYGFETKFDQCICEFSLGPDQFIQMNQTGVDSEMEIIPFDLVLMGPSDQNQYRLSIVVSNHHRNTLRQLVIDMNPQHIDIDLQFYTGRASIFFRPHFGDRFGIADFTFNALAENNIPLIASAFSSASIFLVLPEHFALKAKAVFLNLFEIPKTVQRPSFIRYKSSQLTYKRDERPMNGKIFDEIDWRIRVFESLSFPTLILSPDKIILTANRIFLDQYEMALEEHHRRQTCSNVFYDKRV